MHNTTKAALALIRENCTDLDATCAIIRTNWTGKWSIAGLIEYLHGSATLVAYSEIVDGALRFSCVDEDGTTVATIRI